MCTWRCQVDMTHALATDFRMSDFNATFFTYHTAVLEAFVLAAEAFIITDRPEQLGTEQSIPFRLEGPVVDRFRLFYFTE